MNVETTAIINDVVFRFFGDFKKKIICRYAYVYSKCLAVIFVLRIFPFLLAEIKFLVFVRRGFDFFFA